MWYPKELFPKELPMNLSALYHRILSLTENVLIITVLLLATFALVYWM